MCLHIFCGIDWHPKDLPFWGGKQRGTLARCLQSLARVPLVDLFGFAEQPNQFNGAGGNGSTVCMKIPNLNLILTLVTLPPPLTALKAPGPRFSGQVH